MFMMTKGIVSQRIIDPIEKDCLHDLLSVFHIDLRVYSDTLIQCIYFCISEHYQ